MATIQIRQADGAIRILAVSAADKARVKSDRAMIDTVKVLGAIDVYRDGRHMWGPTGPVYREIPADIRKELEHAAKQ